MVRSLRELAVQTYVSSLETDALPELHPFEESLPNPRRRLIRAFRRELSRMGLDQDFPFKLDSGRNEPVRLKFADGLKLILERRDGKLFLTYHLSCPLCWEPMWRSFSVDGVSREEFLRELGEAIYEVEDELVNHVDSHLLEATRYARLADERRMGERIARLLKVAGYELMSSEKTPTGHVCSEIP